MGWRLIQDSQYRTNPDAKFSAQRGSLTPEGQAGAVAASRLDEGRQQAAAGVFCTSGFFKEGKRWVCARVSWQVLIGQVRSVAK